MIKAMKSLKRDKEEMIQDAFPVSAMEMNDYPYGARLMLNHDDLAKIGVTVDDFQPESLIHVFAMARVVTVHKETTNGKDCCSVTLQVEDLCLENEDEENEMEDQREPLSVRRAKLYDRNRSDDADGDE